VLKFDIKVSIQRKNTTEKYIGELPVLGGAMLGVDAIAGNGFMSHEPLYVIDVFNISRDDMPFFFDDGNNDTLLRYMLGYVLYADSKYDIRLHLKEEEKNFCLFDNKICSFLNYDTYI
jgi:predicted component of type VI protein secretion system